MDVNSKKNGLTHSKRMEALSDGIFAIAATILVLEIKVPEIKDSSTHQLMESLKEIAPSLIAFIFSFLNILIFWVNHDSIGKVLNYFDSKLTYLNAVFLMFISLVPFTTAFVSRYPFSLIAISLYGFVFFLTALIAAVMYYYIAFKSQLMHEKITQKSRKRIWKRVIMGPVFFASAIFLGWIHVLIPIIIYILVPLLFLVMPKIEFEE
jgi:uncharacterized membrane protein